MNECIIWILKFEIHPNLEDSDRTRILNRIFHTCLRLVEHEDDPMYTDAHSRSVPCRRGVVMCRDSNKNEWIYIVKSGTCRVLKLLSKVRPNMSVLTQMTSDLKASTSKVSYWIAAGLVLPDSLPRMSIFSDRIPPFQTKCRSDVREWNSTSK